MQYLLVILFGVVISYAKAKPFGLNFSQTKKGSSLIVENQHALGVVSGFVNSTSQGNGTPHSANAYAWQGGQTSASTIQNATADASNSTASTAGNSTCVQGYMGSAGGPNSTYANSIGDSQCNATYAEDGSHSTSTKTFIPRPSLAHLPPVINMQSTTGQIGEGSSGQFHSSNSASGGPTGGFMNLMAGGLALSPQGGATIQHSIIDNQGKPVLADLDLFTDDGVDSNEATNISTGGGLMNHQSGGLTSIYGLGNSFNTTFNSHAVDKEDETESR